MTKVADKIQPTFYLIAKHTKTKQAKKSQINQLNPKIIYVETWGGVLGVVGWDRKKMIGKDNEKKRIWKTPPVEPKVSE